MHVFIDADNICHEYSLSAIRYIKLFNVFESKIEIYISSNNAIKIDNWEKSLKENFDNNVKIFRHLSPVRPESADAWLVMNMGRILPKTLKSTNNDLNPSKLRKCVVVISSDHFLQESLLILKQNGFSTYSLTKNYNSLHTILNKELSSIVLVKNEFKISNNDFIEKVNATKDGWALSSDIALALIEFDFNEGKRISATKNWERKVCLIEGKEKHFKKIPDDFSLVLNNNV